MLLAALILAASVAQPEPARPTGRYTVLKVSGDLDNDYLCKAITTELESTKDCSLIVLELDGNRARPDLVAKLGAKLKGNPTPITVLLKDTTDKKVGVGQLLLGFYAKSCFIDPTTEIAAASGDDLKPLGPPSTSWDAIAREIEGAVWTRLGERNADRGLAHALTAPREDWFALPGTDVHQPWRCSPATPAITQSNTPPRQVIWATSTGVSRITINPETAIGLAICSAKAQNTTPLLADANLSIRSTRTDRTITNGLSEAAASMTRIIEDAKLAARKISTTLTVKSTPTRPASPQEYRKAAQAALDQIDKAQRDLDRADALLSDYPELERRQSPNPKKPVLKGSIDAIRKDLEKHRLTARDFGSR